VPSAESTANGERWQVAKPTLRRGLHGCWLGSSIPLMKKLITLVTLALAPAAVFAASFEGTVNFKMTGGRGQPQEIRYNIKGDKMRVEMPGQKEMGGMIFDAKNRETTIIMNEQKMYMTMAMPEEMTTPGGGGNAEDTKLEKTGETEKILGYNATKYIATHKDTQTELWLAEGLGTFMGFSNPNPMGGGRRGGGQPAQAWERALAGKDLFPLRVVGHDKGGKENFRMEATAIDKKSLPDTLFAPPADFQKFDMGAMMKGMMPGMKR
jgi:hypothetical protein